MSFPQDCASWFVPAFGALMNADQNSQEIGLGEQGVVELSATVASPAESDTHRSDPTAGISLAVSSHQNRPIELVFGLVGPTGVDLAQVCESLKRQLAGMNYEVHEVSLSEIIEGYDGEPPTHEDEFARISWLMDRGDDLRSRGGGQANIVALLGIIKIRALRGTLTGNPSEPDKERRIAYIVRSFKRPEEVELFRDVYGKAFTLISVYASRAHRIDYLKRKLIARKTDDGVRAPEELALHLMIRDYNEEEEDLGQRVGGTFPLADYFVVGEYRPALEDQLYRLVRLIFGDPYISPSADEQAMFFAQAAALRSLDLSRQVGASIVTSDGAVISTGCNEVPRAGGGLYWAGDTSCNRDFERGEDANVRAKHDLLVDALKRLDGADLLRELDDNESIEKLANKLLFEKPAVLSDSKLFDVIEFGRAVHAEMAAITNAARLGAPLQDSRLFCTTFPCHICARHIVAAGIKEVVFIEPYEKSRVSELYQDSIVVEPSERNSERVIFRSFYGVAPRRYLDFFQPVTKRKQKDGRIRATQDYARTPRIKRITFTYTSVEEAVIKELQPPPRAKRAQA
jgi:deoxycytidylate deaminase